MEKKMNYLDRNEFNFEPSQKVVEAIRQSIPRIFAFIRASMTKVKRVSFP